MPISFNTIPSDLRVPGTYVEFDGRRAQAGVARLDHHVLIVGQRLTTGTVAALTPVAVTSKEQAETYFGKGSMLSHMCAAAIENNAWTRMTAIGINENGAGVAAAGSIDFAGTATAAGTVSLWIGGRRVQAAVAVGDDATDVAAAVQAAIAAKTELPVTAAVNGVDDTIVDITCRWKGATGNDIDLRLNYVEGEALPAGITAVVTAMASGATNPDIATVISAIGDEWYTDIVMPFTDSTNLSTLETELEDRWGPLRQIGAFAYAAVSDTFGNLGTFAATRNNGHVSVVGTKGYPCAPWERAARLGAVAAFHLSIDPARPLQTLILTGELAPAIADRWTFQESNLLLKDGISTLEVTPSGTVAIQRACSTRTLNAQGGADLSFYDVTTHHTLQFIGYDFRVYFENKYPRYKLADDGARFGAGQAVMTPAIGKAELIGRYAEWERLGLVYDMPGFKADSIVERNESDRNRLDFLPVPRLVGGLRVVAVKTEFRL